MRMLFACNKKVSSEGSMGNDKQMTWERTRRCRIMCPACQAGGFPHEGHCESDDQCVVLLD